MLKYLMGGWTDEPYDEDADKAVSLMDLTYLHAQSFKMIQREWN